MQKLSTLYQSSRANKIIAIGTAVVVVIIGYALIMSRASGFGAFLEPEHGSVSGNAKVVNDATASGGKALQFGAKPGQPTPNPAPAAPPSPSPAIWRPPLVTSWQWQLDSPPDPAKTQNVSVYDIQGLDNTEEPSANVTAATVAALHAQGKKVICYISTGSAESYRADYSQFPASVLGKVTPGFNDELYLDIRQINVLAPIMKARLDICKQKGFDAVEPDIDDAFKEGEAVTGFALTEQDQVSYDTFIANETHARGMSIGLKNGADTTFVKDMVPIVDWTLNEQCFEFSECSTLKPFIDAGKAVLQVEYNLDPSQFCTQANAMSFNAMKKNVILDEPRIACR